MPRLRVWTSKIGRLGMAGLVALGLMPASARAQIQLGEDRVVIRDLTQVNSVGLDYGPALFENGLVYVSTQSGKLKRRVKSKGKKEGVTQLWFAARDTAGLPANPQEFLPYLRTRGNEGPVSFSDDLQQLYLTRAAESSKRGSRSNVANRLQIYVSQRGGERWTDPVVLDLGGANSADAHPSIAADGSWLVFASDRDGGQGGMDLWGVQKQGEMWGVPFNLGPTVNTDGNDVFPFLHADGTLYYSTTVQSDLGSGANLDLVYSRQERGEWTEPMPLGAPFNSPADDFGLVVDPVNKSGFFASTRAGGFGGDDLYAFEIYGSTAQPRVELLVEVTDADSRKPVQGAAIAYLNADRTMLSEALSRGVVSAAGEALRVVGGETEMTDVDGRRTIATAGGDYLMEISREGYESAQLPVTLTGTRMVLPISLSPKRACANVRISVVEEGSLSPVVGAQLRVEPQGNTALAPTQELTSGRDGLIDYCLPCGDVYALTALLGDKLGKPAVYDGRAASCTSKDRTTITLYISTQSAVASAKVVRGTPLSAGTSLQLPSVFYALNEFNLSAEAKRDLDGLIEMLNRYPETRIELGSHTDAIGDAGFNQQLSQKRADEARRYLLENGNIEAERVRAVGYGESELRNGCRDGVPCSSEAHRENRRTEVVILGSGEEGEFVRRQRGGSRASYGAAPKSQEPGSRSSGSGATSSERRTEAPGERQSESQYLVVTGNFTSDTEAEAQASKLRSLGYNDVSVQEVRGLNGQSVVAGRFTKLAEAAQFSRALREAHGLMAYVRKVSP